MGGEEPRVRQGQDGRRENNVLTRDGFPADNSPQTLDSHASYSVKKVPQPGELDALFPMGGRVSTPDDPGKPIAVRQDLGKVWICTNQTSRPYLSFLGHPRRSS